MKVFLRFWIKKQNKNFFGKGKVELLQHIKTTGSISKAAKNMRMSYKAAWDSIDSMNHLSEHPVVTSTSGGKGGGGTILTQSGEDIVRVFRHIEEIRKKIENHLDSSSDLGELEKRILDLQHKLTTL